MLTDEIKILAGIESSIPAVNLLHDYIKEAQYHESQKVQRTQNIQYSVVSNLNIFEHKFDELKKMIAAVDVLLTEHNKITFIDGVLDSKFNILQQFADRVIHDDLVEAITYFNNNSTEIVNTVNDIQSINEYICIEDKPSFFATNHITSNGNHTIKFNLFENKDMTKQIGREIPYGTHIISITENIAMVKLDDSTVYASLTLSNLKLLEEIGLLI